MHFDRFILSFAYQNVSGSFPPEEALPALELSVRNPDETAYTVVNRMTRWHMQWRLNQLAAPPDPEQKKKVRTLFNDMTKKMLETGAIQDWGIYADASGGFALWDDKGDTESGLMQSLGMGLMTMPFMTCDVRPVLNIDQAMAASEHV